MASLNKVILIGKLGADPDMRYLPDGTPVASLRLATTETRRDRNTGEKREQTEWHWPLWTDWRFLTVARDGAAARVESRHVVR